MQHPGKNKIFLTKNALSFKHAFFLQAVLIIIVV